MKSPFTISQQSAARDDLAVAAMTALLILMWVYTASSKLMELSVFQFQMQLQPLPEWLSSLLAWLLLPAEFGLAALLLIKRTRYVGLILSFVSLLIFSAYILWMLMTQENIPCACGGPISGLTWWQHLAFNLFFALTALGAMVLKKRTNKQ